MTVLTLKEFNFLNYCNLVYFYCSAFSVSPRGSVAQFDGFSPKSHSDTRVLD